jgi:catechol 2,3-dioxygenase-like lactoylglutathione lyase family enzyme
MNIEFLSTVAVITPDPAASRKLYLDGLGLPLAGDECLHSEQVAGCKSFGIWPLSQAAEALLQNDSMASGAAGPADQHRVRRCGRRIGRPSGTRAPAG